MSKKRRQHGGFYKRNFRIEPPGIIAKKLNFRKFKPNYLKRKQKGGFLGTYLNGYLRRKYPMK